MARTQKWGIVGDGSTYDSFVMYGRVENWNYFVNTDLELDDIACPEGTVKKSGPIPSYSVRRYPGDEDPYTVPAQAAGRTVYLNTSKRSGGALPGKTVIFSTNPETWDGGDERRQFQLVGDYSDLMMYLKGDAEKDIIVETQTGTNYLICASSGGGGGGG